MKEMLSSIPVKEILSGIQSLFSVLSTIILGILAHMYNRRSRYSYMADRWNELMTLNDDEPDFFDEEKTSVYRSFDPRKRTKYHLHARAYWGFVEDVIRNDYSFEEWLGAESFVSAYQDSIKECIRLHLIWLNDNKDKLFTYNKFRRCLKTAFGVDI